MGFDLKTVEHVSAIDRKTFINEFVKPRIPVVLKNYAQDWPAIEKWNFDYMRAVAGNNIVPLYDNSKVDYTKKVNEPIATMTLAEYLDLLESGPTELRIFLYNIFKNAPELCQDYKKSDLTPNILSKFPMMFFGGEQSRVFLHYDIDLSHVFHTQFGGKKVAILFEHKFGNQLYKVPFAVHSNEDIDIENPDFEKWPALKGVNGFKAELEHGDTLFMPSGMWHYMKYIEASFSLSLRALDSSLLTNLKGAYNVLIMRQFDNLARKLGGQKWIEYKDQLSVSRANKTLTQVV